MKIKQFKIIVVIGAVLLVAVGLGMAFTIESTEQPAHAHLSPEKIREQFNREDLSEEDRQALRRQMRDSMRAQMDAHLDEYFAASEEEKVAVLDKHIDAWQTRMQEWRKQRDERRQKLEAQGKDPEEERRRMREQWQRGNRGDQSQQQRKQRSENRSADQSARRMAYMQAMRARMSERGIEMNWGGRSGRSGGGRHSG